MENKVLLKDKWISCEFIEFAQSKTDDCYYLTTKIIPFAQISRNGVKYRRKEVIETMSQIKGLNLHHNHVSDGENVLPRGEWIDAWVDDDYLYGKAKVYNTQYNADYIDWLKSASNIKVSLRADGEVERKKANGNSYKEASIVNWKEISTVNIPGFMDATANFEMMAEKLLVENEEEKITETTETTIDSSHVINTLDKSYNMIKLNHIINKLA